MHTFRQRIDRQDIAGLAHGRRHGPSAFLPNGVAHVARARDAGRVGIGALSGVRHRPRRERADTVVAAVLA